MHISLSNRSLYLNASLLLLIIHCVRPLMSVARMFQLSLLVCFDDVFLQVATLMDSGSYV